ncbi:MAG: hypothetical protein JEZ09_13760 [Salinivirgaceae bacterium]|nr:hypothetical protein [Salinivirgaceae bacterium]
MSTFLIFNKSKDQSVKFFIGGLFLVCAIISWKIYLGYLFVFAFVALLTYRSGKEFKLTDSKFREFYIILGYKKGNWMSLKNYKNLSIKRNRKCLKQFTPRTNNSRTTYETFYEVILMHKSKRSYIVLFSSVKYDKSCEFIDKWSLNLSLPITTYGK